MKNEQHRPPVSRRDFLRGTVAAGAGAALLATTPEGVEAAVESAAPAKDQAQGYRLTPHVAAYYKTAAL
ncbi:MAG: twin-arginine translocation signal domain-containing protein [Thiolinea sp.]